MQVIFIVLPLAILLAGVAVAAFLWAVRGGQYDDFDAPPLRVLFEDDDGDAAPAAADGDTGRRPDVVVARSATNPAAAPAVVTSPSSSTGLRTAAARCSS